ncbi:MAG: ABC transporter permease [Gaiellales bacterium]
MLLYALRRIVSGVVMILLLTMITYVVFFQIPADPGKFLTGERGTTAQLKAADKKLGVDHPIYVQYYHYVEGLIHGQLGTSYASGEPVSSIIRSALPVTASIVVGGAILMLAVAMVIGCMSALRPHTIFDRSVNSLIMFGVALHPLIVGLLLEALFVQTIPLAPSGGYCPASGPGACGTARWAGHLALPWLAFALFLLPNYARVIRTRVLDVLNQPHVMVARAKGASERQVLRSEVLPLLVPTIATMLAVDMSTALMAAIYIEAAFTLPGLGTQAIQAQTGAVGFDLPVIVGIVTVVASTVIVFNVIADLVAARADPRILLGRR